MNTSRTTNLIWLFSTLMLFSNSHFSFANSTDFASAFIVLGTIELELIGGEVSVCEGISLDLEGIPIRELNDIQLDSLNFYLDQACLDQISSSNNNVFTDDISIWAKGYHLDCEDIIEIPIVVLPAPVLLFDQDDIVLCQGETITLSEINLVNLSGLGSEVSFHTEAEPSIENLIDQNTITPEVGYTSIFAYSKYEDCEFILGITIQVEPAPLLVITTQPLVCSGLPLDLEQLVITDINNIGGQPHKYYWNEPFISSNEITNTILNPTQDEVIYAVAIFGSCVSVLEIEITVAQAFYAGSDTTFNFCSNEGIIELNDLLNDDVDPGTWTTMAPNASFDPISNTFNTDSVSAATYQFLYSIPPEGTCEGDNALYNIVLTNAASAGDNTQLTHCVSNSGLVNLFEEINDDRSQNGVFQQIDGDTIDLNSPFSQLLSGYEPGEYTYEYIVNGITPCGADTSLLLIEIIPEPEIFDIEYRCSQDLNSYTIIYLTDAWQVLSDSNFGITSQQTSGGAVNGLDEFVTAEIPINHTAQLTLTTSDGCMSIQNIDPPVCDCPYIAWPTNPQDVKICLPDTVTPLSVTVPVWQGVNWFDEFSDGELLLANSLEYLSLETEVGVYFYWAEAYSLDDPDCVSEGRTLVKLTIDENPQANPITIFGCSDGNLVDYDLSSGDILITPDLGISYYGNLVDANAGINEMDDIYVSSETTGEILFGRVENIAGCFVIIDVTLVPNPYPNVVYDITQITCGSEEGKINIISNDPSQQLEVYLNGGATGTFINGLSAGTNEIEIINQFGCSIDTSITIETAFEYIVLETGCDDNGTLDNANDDFLFFNFLVNPPGNGVEFNLYRYDDSDGFNFLFEDRWDTIGIYNYGELYELELPLHDFSYTWVFRDVDDSTCSDRKIFSAYTTCSDLCGINEAMIHFDLADCDDGGTEFDHTDDIVTFGIEASGSNVGDFWYVQDDPTFIAPYGEIATYGPITIGALDTMYLVDQEKADCRYPLTTYELRTCSEGCDIIMPPIAYNLIACDSFSTPYNNDDDIYTLQVWIQNQHRGRVEFFIEYADKVRGPFRYNQAVVIDSVPAENMLIDLLFRDALDPNCTAQAPQLIAAPCSACYQAITIEDTIHLNCNYDPEPVDLTIIEGGEFKWYRPDTQDTISRLERPEFDTPGTYIVEVLHPTGCTSMDTLEVVFDAVDPISDAGPDKTITCENPMVTMGGSSTQSGNVNYNWYDETNSLVSTDQFFQTDDGGTYTLITISDLTYCESVPDTVVIDLNIERPPVADITADPSTEMNCHFDAISLTPDSISMDYVYTWMFDGDEVQGAGGQDAELKATDLGSYTLVVTNPSNGCREELEIEITRADDSPIVEFDDPQVITCGNPTSEIIIDASQIENFMEVTWLDANQVAYPDESGTTLTVESGGSYFVEVYNPQNDCQTDVEIIVGEDAIFPTFDLGQDTFVPCDSAEIMIQPDFSESFDNLLYEWSNSENSSISTEMNALTASEAGEYYLQVTDTDNDCVAFDTIAIGVNPFLIEDIELNVDQLSCYNDDNGTIEITNFVGSGSGYMASLNEGALIDSFSFNDLEPNTYIINVINEQNCEFSDTVIIESPIEITWTLSPDDDMTYQLGDTIQLIAQTNILEDDILSASWSYGDDQLGDDLITEVVLVESGIFEFELVDVNGCAIMDQLDLNVADQLTNFYIPNIVSSRVEDQNSIFMVYGEKQVQKVLSMQLYDRWGNLFFESYDFIPGELDRGWDSVRAPRHGRSASSNSSSQGVYVYKVEVLLLNNRTETFTGSLTVIR